jgi:hypothetical protein
MSYAIVPLSGDCEYIAHPVVGEPYCATTCPAGWTPVGGAAQMLCVEQKVDKCPGQYLLIDIDDNKWCDDVCPDGWVAGEHNGVMECIEQPEWAEPWVGPHDDPDDPTPNGGGGGGGGGTPPNGGQSSTPSDSYQAAVGVPSGIPWWLFAGAGLLLLGSATYYAQE